MNKCRKQKLLNNYLKSSTMHLAFGKNSISFSYTEWLKKTVSIRNKDAIICGQVHKQNISPNKVSLDKYMEVDER